MDQNQEELWCSDARGEKCILANHCCVVFCRWEQDTVHECMACNGGGGRNGIGKNWNRNEDKMGTGNEDKKYTGNGDKSVSETGIKSVSETRMKGVSETGIKRVSETRIKRVSETLINRVSETRKILV